MTRGGMRRTLTVGLVIVVAVAAFLCLRWWNERAPYGPETIASKSSLMLVDREAAKAAVGDYAPVAGPGDKLVLGRVSWRVPPEPRHGGTYAIALIDKRTDRKPGTLTAAGRTPETVSIGSGWVLNTVADRYEWLAGVGDIRYPDGTARSNGFVIWARENASPVAFVALLPDIEGTSDTAQAPAEVSDLLLALVYIGPEQQIYWAHRLEG